MGGRGQTQLDFAFGVSILLLTIIGSLVFIQAGVFPTFDTTARATSQAQADRVATYLVENYSTEDTAVILRYNRSGPGSIEDRLDDDAGLTRLRGKAGLNVTSTRRTAPDLNVTIVNGTTLGNARTRPATNASGVPLTWGDSYAGATNPGVAVRVVGLENDNLTGDRHICEPSCWLVVRAW